MHSGSTGTDRSSTKLSRFVSVLLCFWYLEAMKAHEKDIRPDMISLDRLWLGSMDIKQSFSGAKIHCPQTVKGIQASWSFIHFRWLHKSQLDFKSLLWTKPHVLFSLSHSILAIYLSMSANVPGCRTGEVQFRYGLRRSGFSQEQSHNVRVYKDLKTSFWS